MSTLLRPATLDDLDAILAIEGQVFGRPWEANAWTQEIQRPFAHVDLACGSDASVLGYACTWHVVAAGETEGHLLRIAVDPAHQRRGVGRDLLAAVLDRASAVPVTRVLLEVGASNGPARRLYAAHGFMEIGRRAGYYKAPPDDAVVMQWRGVPA